MCDPARPGLETMSPALAGGFFFFLNQNFVLLLLFKILFIYLFIFGCVGSSLSARGPSPATASRGHPPPRHAGPSPPRPPRRGAQAPDAQAQQLRPTGQDAPRHAGSSQTRAGTRIPRTSRQTPNHCATREALAGGFLTTMPPGKSLNLYF